MNYWIVCRFYNAWDDTSVHCITNFENVHFPMLKGLIGSDLVFICKDKLVVINLVVLKYIRTS